MKDWQHVVDFTCALPEVEMGRHFGMLVPKVNGKSIVGPSREHDSFGVRTSSIEEKHMLIEINPYGRSDPCLLGYAELETADRLFRIVEARTSGEAA